MKKEIRPFSGEFIKHKGYIAYEDLKNNGYTVCFDEELYSRTGEEIISIIGKKDRYNVEDVVLYFQTKYQAYRVPWEYASWYEDPDLNILFDAKSERSPDSMNPFDYSKSSGEKNITLVIDTVYNISLRKRYPNIAKLENERFKIKPIKDNRIPRCNPIIVIGYRENNVINSLCQCNNYCLSLNSDNPQNNIPDIDYEMWYFNKHS